MPIAENSSLRSPLDRRNIMEYHRSFDLYFDCPVRLRTICICSVPVEGFILSGHHILPACIESCELGLMPLKSHWSHDHSPFLCIGTSKNRGYPKKIYPLDSRKMLNFSIWTPPSSTKTKTNTRQIAIPQWSSGFGFTTTPWTYDHVPTAASLPRRGKSPPASYDIGDDIGILSECHVYGYRIS